MATGTGNGKAPLIEAFSKLSTFIFHYSLKSVRQCQNVISRPNYYPDRDTIYNVEAKVCGNTFIVRETNIRPCYNHDTEEEERNFDFTDYCKKQIAFSTNVCLKSNKLNQNNEIEIIFEPTEETKKYLPDFDYKEAVVSICKLLGKNFCCIVIPEKQLWVHVGND